VANTIATVTLEGLPATTRALAELPKRIAKRCMLKAIRAGGAPLIKAAKRAAPRATGLFVRSLDQRTVSYRGGQAVVSIVGQKKTVTSRKKLRKGRGGISGRGDLVPIHFVEANTKPHRIPLEGRGILLLQVPGKGLVAVDHVMHPGTRGQHPIRTAAETASQDAAARFADKLETEVAKEANVTGGI
jgi:hypothetical protein